MTSRLPITRASGSDKEWYRRLGQIPVAPQERRETPKEKRETPPQREQESGPAPEGRAAASGFALVAGMEALKRQLRETFINVLRHREEARAYGLRPPSMLFYGPPGCGKTFLAERLAEEAGINFRKVVPDDIACQWIHGTQVKVGELFDEAARRSPTLLFFDEFDAMVPERGADEASRSQNGEVNEFLCRLGDASAHGVTVVAASNRPERIDRAVLRTGRIDELVYIGIPDAAARESLFRMRLASLPTSADICPVELSRRTEGFTSSDIDHMVSAAATRMFNATISGDGAPQPLTQGLLLSIIEGRSPSVTARELRQYERLRSTLQPSARSPAPAIGFA